jgi:hypothetical protein
LDDLHQQTVFPSAQSNAGALVTQFANRERAVDQCPQHCQGRPHQRQQWAVNQDDAKAGDGVKPSQERDQCIIGEEPAHALNREHPVGQFAGIKTAKEIGRQSEETVDQRRLCRLLKPPAQPDQRNSGGQIEHARTESGERQSGNDGQYLCVVAARDRRSE